MKTIEVKHRSGKTLNLEIEKHIGVNYSNMQFRLFGSIATPSIKDGNKSLKVNSYSLEGETKKGIEGLFGIKINSKADLYLVITDESYVMLEKAQSDFDVEVQNWKNDYNKRAELMSRWYEMYDFLDWGDYSINSEREIRVYRNPLPEDNGDKVLVISYKLWNIDNKELASEWDIDFKEAGGTADRNSIIITEELAQKWIEKHTEIQNEIQRNIEEKKRIAEEKKIAEEKRRSNCFSEAKRTGKKVMLYSIFLSGSDIPR
jgi:hypothetical protein